MQDKILDYLKVPLPFWETELTALLIAKKWGDLRLKEVKGSEDYSIEKCLFSQPIDAPETINIPGNHIAIALPTNALKGFHDEHGLIPLPKDEADSKETIQKISDALISLSLVEHVNKFLNNIVQTIQIIKAEDEETDISYSHPAVPFSIFVSVCNDNTLRSNLRLAESILHEAMHLKLSLIEDYVPLIKPFGGNLYFSPWRNEKRPAKGVLHGLFVFRGLLSFFTLIREHTDVQPERKYIDNRIDRIAADIFSLRDFTSCADLTKDGAILTTNLLPLN